MTQWLVDFDAAQSTVPPPPRSRPSLSHLFIGGTALDVDAPFDANADFDTGDLDNLSGFGSLDDVDDDRGSMGDLDE